ncbi:hypothetical protein NKG94_38620 [Micromonospora sp. M12]
MGGPSAAYLHGVEHAASFTDDVHVLVPRPLRIGPQRGLRVHANVITPLPDVEPAEPTAPASTAQRPPSAGPGRTPPQADRPIPGAPNIGRSPEAARPTGAVRPPDVGMPPRPARRHSVPAAVSAGVGGMATARPGDRRATTSAPGSSRIRAA